MSESTLSQKYSADQDQTAYAIVVDTITGKDYAVTKLAFGAEGSVTYVASGSPLPVTAAVTSLPAIPSGSNTIGAVNLAQYTPASGRLPVDGSGVTQPVSGTFWQATQPVSLASVPSHAVTNAGTFAVQVSSALPAGTNNIGDVDVLSLPSIPAGSNVIGGVTQSGTWTVTGSGGTFPVTDSGGSITVDAPVGTPAFVRLSDGSSAISTLPVSLASVPSHAVTNAGTFAVQVSSSLPAGDNNIGDVDVASLPATPAGTNLIGKVSSGDDSGTAYAGTTAMTVKYAPISCSSSGNNEIVAAVTSKKIRVLAYNFIGSGAVNAKWCSASTDKTGLKYIAAAGGGICAPYNKDGWFETASGEALNLHLSGAVAVGGELTYIEV